MEPSAKKKNIIPELPYEIWNQILVCVPAKTVMGLKSVCKSWCGLINSRNFQVSHFDNWRNRVPPSQVIAIWPHRSALLLNSLDLVVGNDMIPSNVRCSHLRFDQFILSRSQRQLYSGGPTLPKYTVLDSYHGLFLIGMSEHVYLCNPLTNSYLALPFPKMDKDFDYSTISLITCWKVVYDPSTRGYVIFYVSHGYRNREAVLISLRIDLMSGGVCGGRKCGDWRQIWSSENLTLMFPDIRAMYFLESISINGKVHWLFRFHELHSMDNTGILTIDIATEESIVTKCSATPISGSSSFFKSNGKFYCLKEISNPSTDQALELWAIDDVDNPKWLKHHVIITMDHKIMNFYGPVVKEGNRLIMRSKNSVFIYDISLKKWRVLDIINSDGNTDRWSVLMSINFSLLGWK